MKNKICQIFPFAVDVSKCPSVDFEPESDEITVRGIICRKNKLGSSIPVSIDGKIIDCEIVYWKPILQKTDYIEKGLHLMMNGL